MNNLFLRIRIFLRNLYPGKTKSSKEEDIIHISPSSLASLTASNKIYEEDELLIKTTINNSDLDDEFGTNNELCKCRTCYIIKDIFLIRTYKCLNERKKHFLWDI